MNQNAYHKCTYLIKIVMYLNIHWILWEDFTCLDISQCKLNKAILHVAAKFLESNISSCLGEFLCLGIKASTWSRKHLKMILMSTEDSPEEEHSGFFYQLLLDLLGYSAASISVLTRNSISKSKELMHTVESFVFEQLSLTKDSLSEIKRITTFGLEVQKMAQLVLDAVIRLCKVYSNGINWDLYSVRTEEHKMTVVNEGGGNADHVLNVTKSAIDKLCEMGTLAANDGGCLVSVLNLSWKGVITLLQLAGGALAAKVNVAGVILNLISLVNESLRRAAQNWLVQEKAVSFVEAKRIFLPVKFYLINAVRIISQYTTQAIYVYKEITRCMVIISTFRIYLSKDECLKAANEALVEILEPSSFHLLSSILNSTQVKQEQKFQVLDCLFIAETDFNALPEVSNINHGPNSISAMLFDSSDAVDGAKMSFLGQVVLFLNLLKSSTDLEDDVRLWMARQLPWLFHCLIDADVYSSCLALQFPTVHASHSEQEFSYQPFFHSILNALKTFTIVMSSRPAWSEIESFLLENLLHPHIICSEIITELWSFMLRHAEADMAYDIIDKLCLLLKCSAYPESVVSPNSALRRISKSICRLVTFGSESVADRVYKFITSDDRSQNSSCMYSALLMEGFPLNLLSEKTKSIAKLRIVTEYFGFLDNLGSELPRPCVFEIYGAPVFSLCAALQSQQIGITDSDMKTLKFLLTVIHKYRESAESAHKTIYRRLLGEVLGIISRMKQLYSSDEMEGIILELRNLFLSRPSLSVCNDQLFTCKPNLASFLAGLGHVKFAEIDDNPRSSAVWELYHMLLREQHWAFAHLAITAFGYFAARTSCNQLWRFVPNDAALSFDLESGTEADEDRFMSELKAFLEKELACLVMKPSHHHLGMLVKEGMMLKDFVQKITFKEPEAVPCEAMEIAEVNQSNKKRKFPDEISKGVELLQNGMKMMGDGLSLWQHNGFTEIQEKFLTHFSRLEDVVTHLASLANTT